MVQCHRRGKGRCLPFSSESVKKYTAVYIAQILRKPSEDINALESVSELAYRSFIQ